MKVVTLLKGIIMGLLDAAIEHAAAELPEHWSITIHVEQGASWVALTDEHGNDIDLETYHDDKVILAKDVVCATETAMNIARVKPKMSVSELAERAGIDISDIQGEDIDVLTGKRMHDDSPSKTLIECADILQFMDELDDKTCHPSDAVTESS